MAAERLVASSSPFDSRSMVSAGESVVCRQTLCFWSGGAIRTIFLSI